VAPPDPPHRAGADPDARGGAAGRRGPAGQPPGHRYRESAEAQYRQARALERLSLTVEQLTQVIGETERAELEQVALGPALRPAAARTLAAPAAALRSVEGAVADPEALRRAEAFLAEFVDGVCRARATTADDLFVAGDVVHTCAAHWPRCGRGRPPAQGTRRRLW